MPENVPEQEPVQPGSPRPPEQQDLPASAATKDAVFRGILAEIKARGGGDLATVPAGDSAEVRFRNLDYGGRVEFAQAATTADSAPPSPAEIFDYNYRESPGDPLLREVTGHDEDGHELLRELTEPEAQALLERMRAASAPPQPNTGGEPGPEPDQRQPEQKSEPSASLETVSDVWFSLLDNIPPDNQQSQITIPTGEVSQVEFADTGHGIRVTFRDEEPTSSHPGGAEVISTTYDYNNDDPEHPRLRLVGMNEDTLEETMRDLNQDEADALNGRLLNIKPYERKERKQQNG